MPANEAVALMVICFLAGAVAGASTMAQKGRFIPASSGTEMALDSPRPPMVPSAP